MEKRVLHSKQELAIHMWTLSALYNFVFLVVVRNVVLLFNNLYIFYIQEHPGMCAFHDPDANETSAKIKYQTLHLLSDFFSLIIFEVTLSSTLNKALNQEL